MYNIEPFHSFNNRMNEDVNTEIVQAKLKITELKEQISEEIAKQKDAETIEDKIKSVNTQANLYQKMPGLLRDLSSKMQNKSISGDSTHVY